MHTPRKRFGQNFLQDAGIINSIISSLHIKKNEHFIEIGPGQGALTEPLLNKGIRLDVVELDRDLVEVLVKKFDRYVNFNIYSADALTFNFSALAAEGEKLRVIGNLPYNISTPLLFHLLKYADCIEDMHFMLQKEVVDRMVASPGGRDYGRLSVMIQYHCHVEALFDVGPGSFTPAPKVNSTIVRLEPYTYKPVEVTNTRIFRQVVSQAFSMRRKTIRNALKQLMDEERIRACNINPDLRPEMLDVADYARLAEKVPAQQQA